MPEVAGKPPSRIAVYDTTLRDGTQGEGISLSCKDKLRVATRLDEMGFSFIEGGWPGSNPKDVEFFKRAADIEWRCAQVAAFGSTRRAGVRPEDDEQLHALLAAETTVCTIFGKTWTLHVTEVLRTGLDENVRMIEESVRYLRTAQRRVLYDAEHFFDGWKADSVYALECLRAATRGGAESVILCDTNGGTLPWEVAEIVRQVCAELDHPVGIHAHNDAECAVANSLAAVASGATQVQGTVNGYGERCGNANLCAILPSLELKLGKPCLPEGKLRDLRELSRFVAEVANVPFDERMAYIGRSAFAHKGGVHVSAMRRHSESYEHVDPALVGNETRVVVSELSGRSNLLSKAEEWGVQVSSGLEAGVLELIKESEARGFSYEAAEASVALLMRRHTSGYRPLFRLVDFQVTSGRRQNTHHFAEAMVKLMVGEDILHTVAEGNGPVSALDAALRKALRPVFPELKKIQLSDYKVRILSGTDGTSATTRVLIDHRQGQRAWSTVGASADIIEASLHALVDGIEYGLLEAGVTRPVVAEAS